MRPKKNSTPHRVEPLEERSMLDGLPLIVGDMNGDGVVTNFDIQPFQTALGDTAVYLQEFPTLTDFAARGDADHNGRFDNFDIQAFVDLLTNPNGEQPGVWISRDEIMRLPTSGTAWQTLLSASQQNTSSPSLQDQDDDTDVFVLAKALVGVRLNDEGLKAQARSAILAAMGTEDGGRTLALGRNLASYVIAADLVGLDAASDVIFRNWLRAVSVEQLDGDTLRSTNEDRPNNWGLMSGSSRAAVAAYLGDTADMARVAQVFKGWLGDRSSYAGFDYGDLSWQADPSNPVGINPAGSVKEGHDIGGALPEEMRRGGDFAWPPTPTNYPWGALQGAVVQAEILRRAGYDAWQWQDRAILRAVEFLYSIGWPATGDDKWVISLVNARYGRSFATSDTAGAGKIMGWTAWTHGPAAGTSGVASASTEPISLPAVAASATAVSTTSISIAEAAIETPPPLATVAGGGQSDIKTVDRAVTAPNQVGSTTKRARATRMPLAKIAPQQVEKLLEDNADKTERD